MKVLALNFNIKGVGTFRRTFYFSRELARAGHKVTMCTVSRGSLYRKHEYWKRDWVGEHGQPRGPGPWVRVLEGPNLGYRWLPGWGSGPLDICLRLEEILLGNYDVVYGFEHHPNVSWPVYLTRRLKGYRFYSDWCDWFGGGANQFRGWKLAHRVDAFLEEEIRFRASKVTVTSSLLRERALKMGIPPDMVIEIPEGAATDYVAPMDQARARQALGLPLGAPIIVAVRSGNMIREIEIFNSVLKCLPTTLLVIIGRPSVKGTQRARELAISEHIIHTGWVSDEDYPRYLACSDLCICPLLDGLTDCARWPAKVLDCLSAGRTVVTNDVGEVGRLFRSERIGALASHGCGEFAESVLALLLDADRRRELAERAREIMVKKWDWTNRGEAIAGVLEG